MATLSYYKAYQRFRPANSTSEWVSHEIVIPCYSTSEDISAYIGAGGKKVYSEQSKTLTADGAILEGIFSFSSAFGTYLGQSTFYFGWGGESTDYDYTAAYANDTIMANCLTVAEIGERGYASYISQATVNVSFDESFDTLVFAGDRYSSGGSLHIGILGCALCRNYGGTNTGEIIYPALIYDANSDRYYGCQLEVMTGHYNIYRAMVEIFPYNQRLNDIVSTLTPIPPEEPGDPFEPGGTTGDDETDPEGGDGTFENEEVTVDPPSLPSLTALQTGFISVYNPSYAEMQDLGNYLWSDLFSLDTFKKLFSDPMQAILGLSIVPVQPQTQTGNVVIGNINTGLTMPRVINQFVQVDCGSVTIPEYWGGYLDYSPYTKIEIYLPYIGVRPLDTDECMGRTLRVVYNIDVISGSCACFIQCDNTIRYHYVGQCGASIPITANDWTRVVNGAVSIATALGVGVATLGTGAAAAGASVASMAGAGALVGGIASQVLSSKPRVEHSGSLAGMGGLLGVQFPYIMLVRPRQAVPSGQNRFTGYPAFIRRTLATVTGYTQITGVHLVNITCTDDEKNEIRRLLEAGVIL